MAPERIHVVVAGGIVLAAYRDQSADSADMHARCITGASVVSCELLNRVPAEVLDDIQVEWDADADEDTPITHVSLDDVD